MTTGLQQQHPPTITELAPSFKIPGCLLLIAGGLSCLSWWLGGAIAILGIFLTIQAGLIRLQFTDQELKVLRQRQEIRSFPYSEWLNWKIFWQPIPVLFYFKEVNSIHFLPIIFDAKVLAQCLQKYYPLQQD